MKIVAFKIVEEGIQLFYQTIEGFTQSYVVPFNRDFYNHLLDIFGYESPKGNENP